MTTTTDAPAWHLTARTYWRVHPAGEAPETVLDVSRRDGWTVDDDVHPTGIPVCASLDELRTYIRTYSLAVQPGDVVLELRGRIVDRDRDCGAQRIEVASIAAVHPASVLVEAVDDEDGEDE